MIFEGPLAQRIWAHMVQRGSPWVLNYNEKHQSILGSTSPLLAPDFHNATYMNYCTMLLPKWFML